MAAAKASLNDGYHVVILVVEDEALIRFDMADTLREQPGVTVIEATTADEAWQYLQDHGPVDLVFTDHRMPGQMTGGQLAAKVTAMYPSTKVMVTSAHFDGTEWKGPILRKPYDATHLAGQLVRMARQANSS
jgi:CheY-like chemotaxis protein